jgi:uncharacterized protein (UPF0147 family)
MAKALEVSVNVKHLEIIQKLVHVIKDVVDDERIPSVVREEVLHKLNDILESKDPE